MVFLGVSFFMGSRPAGFCTDVAFSATGADALDAMGEVGVSGGLGEGVFRDFSVVSRRPPGRVLAGRIAVGFVTV